MVIKTFDFCYLLLHSLLPHTIFFNITNFSFEFTELSRVGQIHDFSKDLLSFIRAK